jgi:hypothetical protein
MNVDKIFYFCIAVLIATSISLAASSLAIAAFLAMLPQSRWGNSATIVLSLTTKGLSLLISKTVTFPEANGDTKLIVY